MLYECLKVNKIREKKGIEERKGESDRKVRIIFCIGTTYKNLWGPLITYANSGKLNTEKKNSNPKG